MKKILAIIFLLGLSGYAIFQVFAEDNPPVGNTAGEMARDFDLVTLDGESVKLSDYRGKKVILNFWATWCGPCRAEMPEMQEFSESNKEEVVVLALNLTSQESSIDTVREYVEEGGYTFPIILDEDGFFRNYEVMTMPTTFFIDSEGLISYRHLGPMTYELMEEQVKKMN
ncbi:TlpA disulfide reductase family protein [Sutcliffiella deserti]|uniref:TlpA disulfide reductase family protein n=1 Tax=Sutcliffiella deserti TaxID=2875501 RepID=UPI001CC194CD|nr:TlpA disulfide reductase family protein [Sutcliffiella deserti]